MTTRPVRSLARDDESPRRDCVSPTALAAAAYFALQAVAGVVLWVGVATSDVVRSWLELVPERPEVTDAFFPADLVVIVASALAAWALWRARTWALVPVLGTVGAVVYPTVFLAGWVAGTDGSGEVALGIMVATSALCSGAATLVWRAGCGADAGRWRAPAAGSGWVQDAGQVSRLGPADRAATDRSAR